MFYTGFFSKKNFEELWIQNQMYIGAFDFRNLKELLLAPFLFSSPPEKKNGYCRHSAFSFIYEWQIYTVTKEKKTKTEYETDISSE